VRKLLILFLMIISFAAAAQEGLAPLMTDPVPDSVQLEAERQMMYHQLLNGTLDSDLFTQPIQLPEFDFKSEIIQRWNLNFNDLAYSPGYFGAFYPGRFTFQPSQFLLSGTVFSAGEYQFSDKFKVGGFSYGANSVFSAPIPNNGFNTNYDYRGASMFMQYKVSKNFKIETRVNVQQNNNPGF